MKQLFNFDQPIIRSLLETDTYKIRMLYFIWTYFPDLTAQFAFTNRTRAVQLGQEIDLDQLREEIGAAKMLRFTDAEIAFLRTNEKYPEDFLQFLKELTLSDIALERTKDGQLRIETAQDLWTKTTLWELIVLPIINELYARSVLANSGISEDCVIVEGRRRLRAKALMLNNSGVQALQFGLRRRLSGAWEKHMTEMALELMPGVITAVSNVQLARELGVAYAGTNAHELSMALNALRWNDGPDAAKQSQYEVFEKWFELYDGPARIILPDTFGSKQFLDNIPVRLLENAQGFRQDSGDPIEFGEWVLDAWARTNIDPRERTIFFSDGLTAEKMLRINDYFKDATNTLFGWGTNFSNDTGQVKPVSIVMKLVRAAGNPAVKLSDNLAKAIGDKEAVDRNKKLYGYDVVRDEVCVY